jgi:hypothetical protein
MSPGDLPLAIYRGDTYKWRFLVWADVDKTEAVDLAGVAVKSEIRNAPAGTEIIPLPCVITLPNIIDIELTAAVSRTLPASGVWDLQLTYSSGYVATILAGAVTVRADVTDSTVVMMARRA